MMRPISILVLLVTLGAGSAAQTPLLDIGSQRQLFLDNSWFEANQNLQMRLHAPQIREVAITSDRPWEKGGIHYSSVIQDGPLYRMWYRADDGSEKIDASLSCYAESRDGIHWTKPDLGKVEFAGSRANNIVGRREFFNASVLLDPNVNPGSAGRYKMITQYRGITGYLSSNGFDWTPAQPDPLVTEGPFDSHNTLLWDDERSRYVIYLRGVDTSSGGPVLWDPQKRRYVHNQPDADRTGLKWGRRAIRRTESADFRHWSRPELVLARDERDPINLHHYTNAAVKYSRAGRAFLMFPMVLYVSDDRSRGYQVGYSDVQFASSADGVHWQRLFRQPVLTPGLDERNWVDRNPIIGHGMVTTGPNEVSMYFSELLRSPGSRFRRCSFRTDGFVSVEGPYEGWGEFTTRPFRFAGSRLELNYSTSGGGAIRVELLNEAGRPQEGYRLADCRSIVGDKIDGLVSWKNSDSVSALAGKTIRLRVQLRDAHLYAFRFAP